MSPGPGLAVVGKAWPEASTTPVFFEGETTDGVANASLARGALSCRIAPRPYLKWPPTNSINFGSVISLEVLSETTALLNWGVSSRKCLNSS